ncbi:hypothetical protein CSA08_03220 [Candidatus Gracilibacteria bacterium]|nr:MAG: hypothetical protein CSA08_03220 [Candidatus Gracilibacteria bacterium]
MESNNLTLNEGEIGNPSDFGENILKTIEELRNQYNETLDPKILDLMELAKEEMEKRAEGYLGFYS